jgi:hypothetical protein
MRGSAALEDLSCQAKILKCFDFPLFIFRLSFVIAEATVPIMTNDKRKMNNGKSTSIPQQIFR